jgi:hypothetical protein
LVLLQLILLVVAITALFAAVGLGPVLLLAPDLGGAELCLAPFVGLAAMYWVSQWFSPYFASGPVIVGTCVVGGVFSLAMLVWRRGAVGTMLRTSRVDLAIVSVSGLVMALLLQLPLLHSGVFTLNDFSGDDLFTWAPSAAYMQTHAYAAGHPTSYVSPLLWLLPTNIYPGSAGTVDGGLLQIFGLHSYQLVEPLTAVCLALGGCAVYPFLRHGAGTTRLIAVLGLLFVATSQFRFLTAGFGFAQSARGTALMMAALLLFLLAFTRRDSGSAVLAGGVFAVLMGVYMPAFLIALAGVVGGGIVILLPIARRQAVTVPWQPVIAFVISGIAFGVQNLRWLLFGGGLHNWVLQTHYGRSPLFLKFGLQYLTGSAPVEYALRVAGDPPFSSHLFWNAALSDLALFAAVVAIVLTLMGAVALFVDARYVAGASLVATLAYSAFVFLDNDGGFGSFLAVAYVTPILGIVAAYGVGFAARRLRPTERPRHMRERRATGLALGTVALSASALVVLAFQAGASAEDEAFFVQQPGMLPAANLKLAAIASRIPEGATVLMYASDGSSPNATLRKTRALVAAASFLPDRNVTIDGSFFTGTYGPADRAQIDAAYAAPYQYVLHYDEAGLGDPRVPSTYHVVWTFPKDHLVLYERNGK